MDDVLIIRPPKTKDEYNLMHDLKWRVLRESLGQPKGTGIKETANDYELIALVDNKIIGTAGYKKLNDTVAMVKDLVVENAYRKRGVARNLMEALEMTAKKQGFIHLILLTRENSTTTLKKLGFTSIETVSNNNIQYVKMIKKLKKSRLDSYFNL